MPLSLGLLELGNENGQEEALANIQKKIAKDKVYAESRSRKRGKGPQQRYPVEEDCMISMFHSDHLSSTNQSMAGDDIRNRRSTISDESLELNSVPKLAGIKNVNNDNLTININIPPTPQHPGGRKSGKGRQQPETLV